MTTYHVIIDLNSVHMEVDADSEEEAIEYAVNAVRDSSTVDELLSSLNAFVDYDEDENN